MKQAAAIARVPVLDVTKHRRNGKRRNGRNGHQTLADHFARSTPAERAEAGRVVGLDVVWDQMISPVIDEQRGTEAERE